MDGGFYRCAHCRGFWEVELDKCKYCGYQTVVTGRDGKARIFEDRETCRAIQIAQWERLPADVRQDPMGPPSDELDEVCGCLHCGPDGPLFEAVEMRWMENEGMWACPCTTCGGRGYHFDIHPISNKWECAKCRHKWAPPDGNAKPSNCKCPKCGCTEASGWFQDEYSQDEIEAMSEEEYKAAFGQTRAEEEAEYKAFREKWEREHPKEEGKDEAVPFADDEVETGQPYDPEVGFAEEMAEERGEGNPYPVERMPDDIDYPREGIRGKREGPFNEDDIPW